MNIIIFIFFVFFCLNNNKKNNRLWYRTLALEVFAFCTENCQKMVFLYKNYDKKGKNGIKKIVIFWMFFECFYWEFFSIFNFFSLFFNTKKHSKKLGKKAIFSEFISGIHFLTQNLLIISRKNDVLFSNTFKSRNFFFF